MIQLTFFMVPVGKARARVMVNPDPRFGKAKPHAYTPDKTAAAEALMRAETLSWANRKQVRRFPLFEYGLPIRMSMNFVMPRPMKLKRVLPTVKPDLDNMAHLVADSIRRIIYADDSQICGIELEKEYVEDGGLPRIELTVWEALPADQPIKQKARRKNDGKK